MINHYRNYMIAPGLSFQCGVCHKKYSRWFKNNMTIEVMNRRFYKMIEKHMAHHHPNVK